jgi:hypothetical protein
VGTAELYFNNVIPSVYSFHLERPVGSLSLSVTIPVVSLCLVLQSRVRLHRRYICICLSRFRERYRTGRLYFNCPHIHHLALSGKPRLYMLGALPVPPLPVCVCTTSCDCTKLALK